MTDYTCRPKVTVQSTLCPTVHLGTICLGGYFLYNAEPWQSLCVDACTGMIRVIRVRRPDKGIETLSGCHPVLPLKLVEITLSQPCCDHQDRCDRGDSGAHGSCRTR